MMSFSRPVVSGRVLATSVTFGALAIFLLMALGVFDIGGFHSFGGFFCLVMSGAVLLGIAGGGTLLVVADALLLGIYVVVAFTPIIAGPAERWVRNDPPGARPVDAVVVLSGWVKSDSALEAIAVERLLTGVELVQAGVGPRLITTRVVVSDEGRRIVSDYGQRAIIRIGGLESKWTEVDSVGTTRDEAVRTANLLALSGEHTVAVVTSPMHTRRACAVFEGVGLTVRCVASRESVNVTRHPTSPLDCLAAFREYVYERLGIIKYRHKQWIR